MRLKTPELRHRLHAWVMIIGFSLAVASPALRYITGPRSDGFPLSWYPMFRNIRKDTLRAIYVYGVNEDGTHHKVTYKYWARGGFNQGRAQLHAAVKAGKRATMRKCEKVAARIGKSRKGWRSKVETVRIAKGRFDAETFFIQGDRTPLRERVLVECPVIRDASKKEEAR
jgi:hypothetical protein